MWLFSAMREPLIDWLTIVDKSVSTTSQIDGGISDLNIEALCFLLEQLKRLDTLDLSCLNAVRIHEIHLCACLCVFLRVYMLPSDISKVSLSFHRSFYSSADSIDSFRLTLDRQRSDFTGCPIACIGLKAIAAHHNGSIMSFSTISITIASQLPFSLSSSQLLSLSITDLMIGTFLGSVGLNRLLKSTSMLTTLSIGGGLMMIGMNKFIEPFWKFA